jgi:REDY-like protein HapK
MPVVFFLNRLRPEASSADYERWVREVDYPTARALPPIMSYVVAKMTATLDGQPAPYDYIERVEITDIDDYRAALADPSMAGFANEWSNHVGESVAVFGEEIVS